MDRKSPHFLSKEEDPDMRLEENPMVFCHFLRCPEDSSGCASKCFYKGCIASHIGKNLCSLEISVVLQSHLPEIEPFQVHPSILAVSQLKFWKLVLDYYGFIYIPSRYQPIFILILSKKTS